MSFASQSHESATNASRRTVLKGAAWSVPVIAVAARAPLAAATNTPCNPPLVPAASNWATDSFNLHQWNPNLAPVNFREQDGVRYVWAADESGALNNDAWGEGWAEGSASLGSLSAGLYMFNFGIRANYGTNSESPMPDPDHSNSFRADVQGFIEYVPTGVRTSVTPVYSTREAVAPADPVLGKAQIPNVVDGNNEGLIAAPFQPFSSSFTIPGGAEGEYRFVWRFTEADRGSMPYQLDDDNNPTGEESKNDDIDITFPNFTTSC